MRGRTENEVSSSARLFPKSFTHASFRVHAVKKSLSSAPLFIRLLSSGEKTRFSTPSCFRPVCSRSIPTGASDDTPATRSLLWDMLKCGPFSVYGFPFSLYRISVSGSPCQIAYHRTCSNGKGSFRSFKPPRKVSFAKLPGQSFNLFCFEKKYGHSPKSRTLVILIRVRRFLMAAEI